MLKEGLGMMQHNCDGIETQCDKLCNPKPRLPKADLVGFGWPDRHFWFSFDFGRETET